MLGIILLSFFLLIIVLIVLLEVRNERKYQEKRRQKLQKKEEITTEKTPLVDPKKAKIEVAPKKETQQKEAPKKRKKLPNCTYPLFTHERLIEMGLSDDEAEEFVQELIPQLEAQIPLIEEAYKNEDFHQMERLTHSIKGSATNLGTGGISDLLVESNTYLKTGTDIDIAKVYLDSLKHYTQTLKEQYN